MARTFKPANLFRVAILCDFAEERWPSMDLVGDMLLENLQRYHSATIRTIRIRPRFVRRFSRFRAASQLADKADRLLNRMFDYPRYLRDFDNAAWPLLIFESGPTPMWFDRFKLRL